VRDREAVRTVLERARADALVHPAFVLNPSHDEHLMYDVNVNGTHNVLEAAGQVGTQQPLVTSSAAAHGAFPDHPVPLTEDDPVRGVERMKWSTGPGAYPEGGRVALAGVSESARFGGKRHRGLAPVLVVAQRAFRICRGRCRPWRRPRPKRDTGPRRTSARHLIGDSVGCGYSKTAAPSSRRVGHERRWTSSFLSVAKKLSATALS
jgi:NAD dependent epimerase/dehydratase family